MKLEDLKVYQISMDLGEKIWKIVFKWDNFSKDTMGKQLIRSVDSIAANLSEGFGRYHFKEKMKFGYYSRGSLQETKTWLTKANCRGLIKNETFTQFVEEINDIGVRLNNYINATYKQINQAKEDKPDYHLNIE